MSRHLIGVAVNYSGAHMSCVGLLVVVKIIIDAIGIYPNMVVVVIDAIDAAGIMGHGT